MIILYLYYRGGAHALANCPGCAITIEKLAYEYNKGHYCNLSITRQS